MPNAIKPLYSSVNTLTITLASLASSTGGLSARQSTFVDNTTTRYARIHVYPKVKLGSAPTATRLVYVWALMGDGTNRTDGAGGTDAALTVKNAELRITAVTTSTTGENIQPYFTIENPGREWAVAIGHDTGVNLDSTGSNHVVDWVGEVMEVQ